MGKNRHCKDKLYIVASEYKSDWGGYKNQEKRLPFRRLPFYCCALSLRPFSDPVATSEGLVFDEGSILSYLKKYGRNPVTGEPLRAKDLIPLRFHKNSDGEFHCPVTYKQFNDHSFIVANRKTGHVYSNDAIEALCRRTQSWFDLLSNEPFSPSDLIIIQNPHNLDLRRIDHFDYVKKGILAIPKGNIQVEGIPTEEDAFKPKMKETPIITETLYETRQLEDELRLKHKSLFPCGKKDDQKKSDASTSECLPRDHESSGCTPKHELFTTPAQAASFTSTRVAVSYNLEYRNLTSRELRQEMYKAIKKKKKKGYVRLETSLGPLNLELHTDKAPETCHNFLLHCQSGYYKDTIFHRSIKNFMIQGGDPTGTGTGGASAFGDEEPEFPDEFHPHLVHKGPGILSMANKGKNTNRSQFFVTYNSCEYLNNQHTVFGRLVGGSETLKKMHQVPTTSNDVPIETIKILDCIVYQNPFDEYYEEKKNQKEREEESLDRPTLEELLDPMCKHAKRDCLEVGKYADLKALVQKQQEHQNTSKLKVSSFHLGGEAKKQRFSLNSKLSFADW